MWFLLAYDLVLPDVVVQSTQIQLYSEFSCFKTKECFALLHILLPSALSTSFQVQKKLAQSQKSHLSCLTLRQEMIALVLDLKLIKVLCL
jgi:hypothetical protein